MKGKSLSRVRLLATPWTVARQAPPSMGFSRQEYWSGVPLPSPKVFLFTPVSSLFSYSLMDQLPYSSFIPGSRSSPETCYYHGRRRKKQEGWCSLPCLLRFLFSIGICHFCSDFIGQGGPWSSLLSVRQGILLLLQRSTAVGDNGERDLILLQAR